MMNTNIAICGRTNAGKTALITTIRGEYSGEIEDASSTTKTINQLDHKILSVTINDFPGFEKIGAVEALLNVYKKNPEVADSLKDVMLKDEISKRDFFLIEQIPYMDVVVIVCSIENVPDGSHEVEINLIKSVNKNVIAIISKTDLEENQERIELWKKTLRKLSIRDIILFDAHFDNKTKIVEIFNVAAKYVSDNNKHKTLVESIEKIRKEFNKHNISTKEAFINFIEALRNVNILVRGNKTNESKKLEFQNKIESAFDKFRTAIVEIYKIDIDQLCNIFDFVDSKHNILDHKDYEIGGMTVGSISTFVPVWIYTMLIAASPLAPLLVLPAVLGGGFLGKKAGDYFESQKKSCLTIDEDNINYLAKLSLLIIWVSSRFGYAHKYSKENKDNKSKIQNSTLEKFKSKLNKISNMEYFDKTNISHWYDKAINELEN